VFVSPLLILVRKNTLYFIWCVFFLTKIPDYSKRECIIKNTAWLSVFFDAEGHYSIMNEFTLAFHIGQKDKLILQIICDALNLSNFRYDSSWDGWIYTICN